MKERNTDMSFKKSKRSAYRSGRPSQLAPRFPQAALVDGRDEDLDGVDSVHFRTARNVISKARRARPAWPAAPAYLQIGGTTPSFSTSTTCASKTPSLVGVVSTNIFLPATRSARVAGAKVTTGALSGTVTTLLPPL